MIVMKVLSFFYNFGCYYLRILRIIRGNSESNFFVFEGVLSLDRDLNVRVLGLFFL